LQLGRAVEWPDSPEKAKLDRVPNPQAGTNYLVRFTAPEFTSICPVTGQPDFAHLVIDYVPGPWLLEIEVAEALRRQLPQPRRLPRGLHRDDRPAHRRRRQAENGCAYGGYWYHARRHPDRRVLARPANCRRTFWVPDQGVAPYRGRG
jgi:7-cyano-7-deazaguanine reductase